MTGVESDQTYWDRTFAKLDLGRPQYDDWLDRHAELLRRSEDVPVIDLGCGYGCDTLYLAERGYRVIACDLSEEALRRIRMHIPETETRQFNVLNGLPFTDASARAVVADLSLHYFSWRDTVRVVADIRRVLEPGGVLLARFNSVRDVNYGAGAGTELEPGYFEHEGRRKRFFTENDLRELFSPEGWEIRYLQETDMLRYGSPKKCWELAAVAAEAG
jgi:SAM-dependent methyltransferase